MAVMHAIRAVLFDWRGTLVVDWPDDWWVRRALAAVDRTPERDQVETICRGLDSAREIPRVANLLRNADISAEHHRLANWAWFDAAGLEAELAEALYHLDFDPLSHPFADDVGEVLEALRDQGVRVAVVSDIHLDIRHDFRAAGIAELIDTFVLSHEHGVCKPDPALFHLALDALGVDPHHALMVGDRPDRDGGAVAIGMPTLLVPTLRGPQDRRLHLVASVAAASPFSPLPGAGNGTGE
jgi:HAD superfamily hydrolase (TIGR01509 family)